MYEGPGSAGVVDSRDRAALSGQLLLSATIDAMPTLWRQSTGRQWLEDSCWHMSEPENNHGRTNAERSNARLLVGTGCSWDSYVWNLTTLLAEVLVKITIQRSGL